MAGVLLTRKETWLLPLSLHPSRLQLSKERVDITHRLLLPLNSMTEKRT